MSGIKDELIGTVLGEQYRVVERIARGGMGCVYRAVHVELELEVAIKVLTAPFDADPEVQESFSQLFRREAKAMSRLRHRHCVQIMNFGHTPDGRPYIVMELLHGTSVRDALKREGPFAPQRVAVIGQQVAGALGAAHAVGVIHRDLKPSNIVLLDDDGDDFAKVVDFGIARVAGARTSLLTQLAKPVGTVHYMAPEQFPITDLPIGPPTDLYALGITLFEMLTGKRPFDGQTETEVIRKQIQQPPPLGEVDTGDADRDRAWRALLAWMLAKDPRERPQTAKLVRQALGAIRQRAALERVPEWAWEEADGVASTHVVTPTIPKYLDTSSRPRPSSAPAHRPTGPQPAFRPAAPSAPQPPVSTGAPQPPAAPHEGPDEELDAGRRVPQPPFRWRWVFLSAVIAVAGAGGLLWVALPRAERASDGPLSGVRGPQPIGSVAPKLAPGYERADPPEQGPSVVRRDPTPSREPVSKPAPKPTPQPGPHATAALAGETVPEGPPSKHELSDQAGGQEEDESNEVGTQPKVESAAQPKKESAAQPKKESAAQPRRASQANSVAKSRRRPAPRVEPRSKAPSGGRHLPPLRFGPSVHGGGKKKLPPLQFK